MPDTASFVTFVIAGLLLNLTPGPDVLYIVARSSAQGRAAGTASVFGITAGCLVHIAAAAAGLSALMSKVPLAYKSMRWAGAVYLLWLGGRALLGRQSDVVVQAFETQPLRRIFWQGVVTNALNPKATLFFISLYALVVSPVTPKSIQAGYGIWMALATMAWFSIVTLFFTRTSAGRIFLRHGQWIDRALGGVFLFFAASLVFTSLT